MAKWLLLGLGALGIVYLAIGIAYEKSYYEPRMKQFDYKISEVVKKIDAQVEISTDFVDRLEINRSQQRGIIDQDLPSADAQIEQRKFDVEEIGAKCWLPGWGNSAEQKEACDALDEAQSFKETLSERLDSLEDASEDLNDEIADVSLTIGKHESDLAKLQHDKEAAKADMKGLLMWLAAILGISF